MQTPKPPRWSEEAVAKFVAEVIDDREAEAEYQAAMDEAYYADRLPPMRKSDFAKGHAANIHGEEKAAVAAALRGDLEPLTEFLVNPWTLHGRLSLAPSTRHLIVEFLTGERSLHTGKPKGQPGRPKMSEEKRRAANPIHDAADEFPLIKKILKHYYPTQSAKQIVSRAEEIAKKRGNIATSVQNYRRRSGKHGHKLK